jgi:hypothetical protein
MHTHRPTNHPCQMCWAPAGACRAPLGWCWRPPLKDQRPGVPPWRACPVVLRYCPGPACHGKATPERACQAASRRSRGPSSVWAPWPSSNRALLAGSAGGPGLRWTKPVALAHLFSPASVAGGRPTCFSSLDEMVWISHKNERQKVSRGDFQRTRRDLSNAAVLSI